MDGRDVALLRALKGAPLACLVALGLAGEAASQEWIQTATGYDDEAVTRALKTLEILGLACRVNRYGWQLSAPEGQGRDSNGTPEKPESRATATAEVLNLLIKSSEGMAVAAVGGVTPEKPESRGLPADPLQTARGLRGEAERRMEDAVRGSRGGTRPTTTGRGRTEGATEGAARNGKGRSRGFRRAVRALHEAGIGEPMRSRLAEMAHVTASYVRAHALLAARDGISTGLLVHRLRSGDKAPELNAQGHLQGCKCEGCGRLGSLICGECFRYPCECPASPPDPPS